jgi:hypothetical protein
VALERRGVVLCAFDDPRRCRFAAGGRAAPAVAEIADAYPRRRASIIELIFAGGY